MTSCLFLRLIQVLNDASDKERVAAVFLQSGDLDRSGVGFCRAHAPAHVWLAAALTEALLYTPDPRRSVFVSVK
jgi:hypothetical protein